MKTMDVAVGVYPNEIDAEIAKAHLRDEGIDSIVEKGDVGGMFPSLQETSGVRLFVAQVDEARSRKVLEEKRPHH